MPTPSAQTPPQDSDAALRQALDTQLSYMLSTPNDGSPAIGLGRAAGLAKQVGLDKTAAQMWGMLAQLPASQALPAQMPGIDQIAAAYTQNPANFAAFTSKDNFPAAGNGLSNALGSYAFALDYARRGDAAIANGGEPKWIASWGAQAINAAGFPNQASALAAMVQRRSEEKHL